eukprot:4328454-Lingulodinium_polyedra.AAC.1
MPPYPTRKSVSPRKARASLATQARARAPLGRMPWRAPFALTSAVPQVDLQTFFCSIAVTGGGVG